MCLFAHWVGTQPWKMSFGALHLNIMSCYWRCCDKGSTKVLSHSFAIVLQLWYCYAKVGSLQRKLHMSLVVRLHLCLCTQKCTETHKARSSLFPPAGNRLMSCHSGLEAWKREAAAWFCTKRVTNAHIHTELHTLPWLSSCSDRMTTWLGPHPVSQPLTAASHMCETLSYRHPHPPTTTCVLPTSCLSYPLWAGPLIFHLDIQQTYIKHTPFLNMCILVRSVIFSDAIVSLSCAWLVVLMWQSLAASFFWIVLHPDWFFIKKDTRK